MISEPAFLFILFLKILNLRDLEYTYILSNIIFAISTLKIITTEAITPSKWKKIYKVIINSPLIAEIWQIRKAWI